MGGEWIIVLTLQNITFKIEKGQQAVSINSILIPMTVRNEGTHIVIYVQSKHRKDSRNTNHKIERD